MNRTGDVRGAEPGHEPREPGRPPSASRGCCPGRFAQANRPVPMKPQPITRPEHDDRAAQVRVVAREDRARRRSRRTRSRRRPGPRAPCGATSEQCLQRGAGELCLWNESAHIATVAHRAEVRKVSARREDDRRAPIRWPSAGPRPRFRRCPGAERRAGRRPGRSAWTARSADWPSSASPITSKPSASSSMRALARKLG